MPEKTDIAPVAEGLFTTDTDTPALIGSQCGACGVIAFPQQRSCPRCTSVDVRRHELGRRGTLWSWTIQCFPPKSPPYAVEPGDDFEPYGVGYVELPGEVRVETRLTEADPDRLRIGMPMELTLITVPGVAGSDVVTFAFQPDEAGA